jgi:flavin reductase (NADH)
MTTPLDPTRQTFRNAMSLFSAAVNILTTSGEQGRCGITATAVCSVTDTPPTVLACINRNSATNQVFKANGRLCINVLSGEQESLARHFAGMAGSSMAERFSWDIWEEGEGGLPVLSGSLASLQGRIQRIEEVGTHSIFIIELDEIEVQDDGDSLVYFDRNFHRVQRQPVAQAAAA